MPELGARGEPSAEDYLARYRADLANRQAWRVTQRPALCCECGTIRSTTANGAVRRPPADDTDDSEPSRCIVVRKCLECRRKTPHAYLLVNGRADYVEREQPYPTLDEATETHLLEIELLEARTGGIRVTDQAVSERILVTVSQCLDDGTWTVQLNPSSAPKRLRRGLRTALKAIREAREQTWFVEVANPEHHTPAVRYAVFSETNER